MLRFLHHIGSFLLLAATVLLVVVSITAPVVNNIGLLTVDLPDSIAGSEVSFGTWGWCVQDQGGDDDDFCSKSMVGYDAARVMTDVDGTDFSDYAERTVKALTHVMVLHPVAAGLAFIAFLLSIGAGVIGSLLASLVSALTFIVTLVVLICDFVAFGIVKSNVNNDNNGRFDSHAYFSVGMWCVLVAGICTFLATIVLFFSCCAGRMKKRREDRKVEKHTTPHTTKRRFWQRRRAHA